MEEKIGLLALNSLKVHRRIEFGLSVIKSLFQHLTVSITKEKYKINSLKNIQTAYTEMRCSIHFVL
jgi:hypothetical protein